jgi:hypothetical protein
MRRIAIIGAVLFLALPAHGDPRPPRGRVIADRIFTVADDFIVDVYHNGVKVPDDKRTLVNEVFGATAERIDVEVREGDWLVFNVVNNRLRWGGCSYFGVTGRGEVGVAFVSDPDDGRWSCCDDPGKVSEFIRDRDYLSRHPARRIANPWGEGDALMNQIADGWSGEPIWGEGRNTWIKFVAR